MLINTFYKSPPVRESSPAIGCNSATSAVASLLRGLSAVVTMLVAASVFLPGVAAAQETLDRFTGQILPIAFDTGPIDNPGNATALVAAFPVKVKGSNWIRAYYGLTKLGAGSSVRVWSPADGEVQELNAAGLADWSQSSAYFNGEEVWVELWAGPGTVGNRVVLDRVGFEMPVLPVGDPGQCGICNGDNRTPSAETWSGRIMPVGCSASVYCPTGDGMITAGHCLQGQTNLVAQFNVPNSATSCGTFAPPVADQFPVLSGFQFQNAGVGADWGVLQTGANSLGQTPVRRYNTFRPLATAPAASGTASSIWGYGLDANCVRSQTQQFSPGTINVVSSNNYDLNNDVRGGNSGSGFLNASNQIIGVVTHCAFNGCNNRATRIDLPAFVAARSLLGASCNGGANNNTCGSAANLPLGTVTGNTGVATTDGATNCPSGVATGKDLWYNFSPPCNGTYRFSTCGSAFDTVLSIHTGCPGSASNVVICNDDAAAGTACAGTAQSVVTATLTGGTLYVVRVAGYLGASGAFTLNASAVGVGSPNNVCANATPLSLGSNVNGSTTCDSNDGVASCVSSLSNDVWYTFTPTCSATYTFSTCNAATNFDNVLSLHTACPGVAANQIACNDDSCGTTTAQITASLTAGTTYVLRVGGFAADGAGNFNLKVMGTPTRPVNDLCSAATPLAVGSITGTTGCAANEGNAGCGSNVASPDVWYSYIPDCTQSAVFDSIGSAFDTVLSVYAGCPSGGAPLACDDDGAGNGFSRIPLTLTGGATYYIRVSGFGTASGSYTLTVATGGSNQCATATPIQDGQTFFSTGGATTDGSPEGICNAFGDSNVNQDIWMIYTATCDGEATASTCGSTGSFDTKIAVYAASPCPVTGPIACNDDSCGTLSTVSWTAAAGSSYVIRVGGFTTAFGCGTLTLSCAGNTCVACAADYDESGGVDGGDVTAFFADWSAGAACADVDQSGGVDGNDVDEFFVLWSAGGC